MEFHASRWLEAHLEKNAGIQTFPKNLILADIFGDGDYRLVLVDIEFGQEIKAFLKVYRGSGLVSNQPLTKIPSAIISFYNDQSEPHLPVVGVANESDLLIFKNNKPFYKFSVPPRNASPEEIDVWKRLPHVTDEAEIQILLEKLQSIPLSSLSSRSIKLLSLPQEKIKEELSRFDYLTPTINSVITCLSTLKKNSEDDVSASCPVIGTEDGFIYILDPLTFTILKKVAVANIKSSPFIIQTVGMYDIEFRIVVICRENFVTIISEGNTEGKILFYAGSVVIDAIILSDLDQSLVVATKGKKLHCYSKKGNKLWSVDTIQEITCLCYIPLKSSGIILVGVGMRNGAVHLYQGRHIVDCISAPDTPSALIFGQLGQEEHVLVTVTMKGALNFKILKRTANFNVASEEIVSPSRENHPLSLPKKSKLFYEQIVREKQNASDIHQRFQQDLMKMRVTAARAMINLHPVESVTGNEKEMIKLSAHVLGMGQTFSLILHIENMSNENALTGLTTIFHCDDSLYKLSKYIIIIPLIPPSLSYKVETKVEEVKNSQEPYSEIDDNIIDRKVNIIRVFVMKKGNNNPIATAILNMPQTDIL